MKDLKALSALLIFMHWNKESCAKTSKQGYDEFIEFNSQMCYMAQTNVEHYYIGDQHYWNYQNHTHENMHTSISYYKKNSLTKM
jgi:hypothetical protein